MLQHGPLYRATADDPEQAEYFVRVKWLDTVDATKAFNEVSLFRQSKHRLPTPRRQVAAYGGEVEGSVCELERLSKS